MNTVGSVELTLKAGKDPLRIKGHVFEAGKSKTVPADVAGKILAGHAEDFEKPKGKPVEPASTAGKAEALKILRRTDYTKALAEVPVLPEEALKILFGQDSTDEQIVAVAKAAGPWPCAIVCQMCRVPKRAQICLSALE